MQKYNVHLEQDTSYKLPGLYLLLFCYSHDLHRQRLLLEIESGRRGLITLGILHLESCGIVSLKGNLDVLSLSTYLSNFV
jgi:hypothetical protein